MGKISLLKYNKQIIDEIDGINSRPHIKWRLVNWNFSRLKHNEGKLTNYQKEQFKNAVKRHGETNEIPLHSY